MKIKLEKKYVQIGIVIFFTALAIMAVFFIFFRFDSIKNGFSSFFKYLSPVVYGFIIAYLISPFLNLIESKWIKPMFALHNWKPVTRKGKNVTRGISVGISITVVLFLLYLFFASVIPEVYKSIQSIISNYSQYTENLVSWVNDITRKNPEMAGLFSDMVYNYSDETDNFLSTSVLPYVQNLLLPNLNKYIATFSASIFKFVKFLFNIIIGIVVSIYVLYSKEKFKDGGTRLIYALFDSKTGNVIMNAVKTTHNMFIGFFSGKIVDSIIIGILCYFVMLIMRMPYALLVSMVIAVTNIIPFFGPFLGAIPSAIIILMVDPKKCLYFVIFIIILQQFDGNILGPKILSGTTGVTSFWIIVAITFFGSAWSILGMVIGVPVIALILTFYNSVTSNRLIKKGLPTKGDCYKNVVSISEEGKFVRYEYYQDEINNEKYKQFIENFKKLFKAIGKFFVIIGKFIATIFKNIVSFFKRKSKTKPKSR